MLFSSCRTLHGSKVNKPSSKGNHWMLVFTSLLCCFFATRKTDAAHIVPPVAITTEQAEPSPVSYETDILTTISSWSLSSMSRAKPMTTAQRQLIHESQAESPLSTIKRGLAALPTLAPIKPSLTANTSLYCFPDYARRTRYNNAWGKYIVEVKQGYCGPNNNLFTKNTVSFTGNELKLQFKNVNGAWQASEVRIVLPTSEMPYRYGTYQFSIKSVVHRNTVTNQTISNTTLPRTLAFGFFSWDDTENFTIKENFNHEVDIEISRWGSVKKRDAQFLVQPPELRQWFRFYTGIKPGTYDQGGDTYGFTWTPGKLYWYTTAGGGRTRVYTTKNAVLGRYEDRVQCLPANIEIRMNLWNQYGTSTPPEMSLNEIVEVVIDDFRYTPSALSYVRTGGYCSKHCMCAPPSMCLNGTCTR